MALYRFHVQKISGYFDGCEFFHIPRAENEAADELSKIGSSKQAIPPGVALEHLRKPSIKPSPESESIFIPSMSEHEAQPMEIDANPGTVPGSSAEAMRVEANQEEAQPMEVDEPVFPIRAVPLSAPGSVTFILNSYDSNQSRP